MLQPDPFAAAATWRLAKAAAEIEALSMSESCCRRQERSVTVRKQDGSILLLDAHRGEVQPVDHIGASRCSFKFIDEEWQ